jgi:hypothetical protein
VPADRQEGFDLIGPDEKRSADPSVRITTDHWCPLRKSTRRVTRSLIELRITGSDTIS